MNPETMSRTEWIKWYNYTAFIPPNFEPFMRFNESPQLGTTGPNGALWYTQDQRATTLHDVCSQNLYTIVEFGSFT